MGGGNNAVPTLALSGAASRRHYVGSSLHLQADVTIDSCSSMEAIHFAWNVPGYSTVTNTTSSTSSILIPASFFDQTKVGQLVVSLVSWFGSTPNINSTIFFTVNVITSPFFLTATNTSSVFVRSDPTLSVSVRGHSLATPSYQWYLISCPYLDGTEARIHAQPSGNGAGGSVSLAGDGFICLSSTGVPFAVNIQNSQSSTCHIDYTSIVDGDYILGVDVTVGSLTQSLNFSFALLGASTSIPPAVTIQVPTEVSLLYPQTKLTFQAIVNGVHGTDVLTQFAFEWQILSGASMTTSANTQTPNLVIPYADIIQGQLITLNLTVTEISSTLSSTFSTNFAPTIAPIGGQLFVSPSFGTNDTVFYFSSAPWSALYPPLKYQYSISIENSSVSSFVTPLLDFSPLNISIASLAQTLLLTTSPLSSFSSSQNVSLIVNLAVLDGVGATANSSCILTVEVPPISYVSDDEMLTLLESLEIALNTSRWVDATLTMATLTNSIQNRIALDAESSLETNAAVVDVLVAAIDLISSRLPLNEANYAFLISKVFDLVFVLDPHVNWTSSQLGTLIVSISNNTGAYSQQFGRTTGPNWTATTAFLEIVSSLSSSLLASNLSDAVPGISPALTAFADMTLGSIVTGESLITIESTSGLVFQSEQVPTTYANSVSGGITDATNVTFDHPTHGVRVNFNTTQFQFVGPYVGYHVILHNRTFPHTHPNSTGIVVVTTILGLPVNVSTTPPTNVRPPLPLPPAPGRVVTNFSNNAIPTPPNSNYSSQCVTYDTTTASWIPSNCITTTSAGVVSCDCSGSTGSGLSVIFSLNPSSPNTSPTAPGTSSASSQSTTIIIAAVSSFGGLAIIAAVILLTPAIRRKLQPSSDADRQSKLLRESRQSAK